MIEVRVEGDALELEDSICLIGGVALLLGQGLDRRARWALGVVEDLAGRNDATGGDLTIH